jgi:hypothetical protein
VYRFYITTDYVSKGVSMRRKAWIAAFVLAVTGSTVFSAAAQEFGLPDSTHSFASYAGGACVKTSGTTPTYNFAQIINPSTSTAMFVDCPVDFKRSSADSSLNETIIYVVDRHPSEAVECTFLHIYYDSTGTRFTVTGNADASAGSSSTAKILNSELPSGAVNSKNGHFYISCRIPATSSGNSSFVAHYQANN